jgi:hypothetical protein
MHVITLQGEYHIYNIVTKEKQGELERYKRAEYHWIVLNKLQTYVLIATYDGYLRVINIEDRKNPRFILEYKPKIGLCYAMHWHPVQQAVVAVGGDARLELITFTDLEDKSTWKS